MSDGKSRVAIGREGEDIAARFLENRGHQILARRFRNARGEIDLVSRSGTHVYFTEVKRRRSSDGKQPFGGGLEAIDSRKQRTIARIADLFLDRHQLHHLIPHFAAIILEESPGARHLHFLPDAFDAC